MACPVQTNGETPNRAPAIDLSAFEWDSVDPKCNVHTLRRQASQLKLVPNPLLDVIHEFKGTYTGTGFNLIFRPNNAHGTTFPKPVNPPPPAVPNDNVLELNLTQETLAFSKPLGRVPNRGSGSQRDIFLTGVPYLQTINDVTNRHSGKADGEPVGIHAEPGVWMHVPATKTDPPLGASLVRMGSIPHGTTINAQCLAPSTTFRGSPQIPPVDITPFPIGNPTGKIPFPSQQVVNDGTSRIPQDLSKFVETGAITQDMLNDPNTVLRNANKGKKITETVVFTVSTIPASPELGGGVANIAFLQGSAPVGASGGPNALAVQMSATFWIETMEHEVEVPRWQPGQEPLRLQPRGLRLGAHGPTFVVHPEREVNEPHTTTVTYTQIQYSQTVLLNFAGLTWPHVSVATLVPAEKHVSL